MLPADEQAITTHGLLPAPDCISGGAGDALADDGGLFVHLRYHFSEGGTQCACNASRDTPPDVYSYT